MNVEMALCDVREILAEDDKGKWDTLVKAEDLRYEEGRLSVAGIQTWTGGESLSPTAWAEGQICRRLGIPAPYFRRCPPELKDAQFNHWIGRPLPEPEGEKERGAWLLRCKDSSLRGVLSGRYRRFDNKDLMERVFDALHEGFEVKGFSLTSESLHLRLIDPKVSRKILPDDWLMAGVHLSNSEVGRRAVAIDALVYRLVCTNGLVRLVNGKSLLRRRHFARFEDDLPRACRAAVEEAREAMNRFAALTLQDVPDPEGTVKGFVARSGLPESVVPLALKALTYERTAMQHTMYGLVNALTNAAQSLPADERYEAETMAGRLLDGAVPDGLAARGGERRMLAGAA